MQIINEYASFLRNELEQSKGTIDLRINYVGKFLISIGSLARRSRLSRLRATRIHDYVTDTILPLSRSSRRSTVSSLRSFLRFAYFRGYLPKNIVNAVPVIRTPAKLANIPIGYSWDNVKKLLRMPDRRTTVGQRDYAMLQLLKSYGVRSIQVTSLQLADINWHGCKISFRAVKGSKSLCFPLQTEVAKALLVYLKRARPKTVRPEVFVSLSRRVPTTMHGQLSRIIKDYADRGGIKAARYHGAHAIRHAFATRLVAQKTPMKTISDLMGHRSISTTFIYTKVDIESLRILAREWPEVTQ